MKIFHSDIDNTLIYSYKHDIGADKVCVEIYKQREISFMTKYAYNTLRKINEKYIFVPTTTRTIEQYERIDFGIGTPQFALVCNGGILLINGKSDESWYKESLSLIADCNKEFVKAVNVLKEDVYINFEIRNINDLFIFTKSSEPKKSVERLKSQLDTSLADVFFNGVKVYIVPKLLSKGKAVERFRLKIGSGSAEAVIAAGDSEFDIPMLESADIALAPKELGAEFFENNFKNNLIIRCDENKLFSDYVMEYLAANNLNN